MPPPRLAQLLLRLVLPRAAWEEITGDLQQEWHEQLAAGEPRRSAARRYWRGAIGSIAATRFEKDAMTAPSPVSLVSGLALDLRGILRAMRRSPGFVVVSVASLAIGIGATTAIVSVVRQVLLNPLPVERPDELRLLYWRPHDNKTLRLSQRQATGYRDDQGVDYRSNFHWPAYVAMRDAVGGRASLAAYTPIAQLTVAADHLMPVTADGVVASGNFFETIRPPLAMGRFFGPQDDAAGAPVVTVIGYAFWQRYFGGAGDVLGRVVRVNDASATIVGITAPDYRSLSAAGFARATDLTLPMSALPQLASGWVAKGQSIFSATDLFWMRAVARVTGDELAVREALRPALKAALAAGGQPADQAAGAEPQLFPGLRGQDSLRRSATPQLRILSAVSFAVLIIACLNVAGLLVARGAARQREMAVRRSLGATRWHIARDLLLESLLLSAAGGAGGIALAVLAAPLLRKMLSDGLGTVNVTLALDGSLLLTTLAIGCGAALVAGLIPAIRFSRRDSTWLAQRSGAGSPRLFVGRVLLAIQIAVSLPLIAGAGLFLRTLHNLASIDLGFDPQALVLFNVDPTRSGRAPARFAEVFPRVLDEVGRVDGVAAVTLLENPLLYGWESDTEVRVGDTEGVMYQNAVGPDYFETMRVPLVSGRALDASDVATSMPVAVINQTAARKFFGTESPLGGTIIAGGRTIQVAGVMADAKYDRLRDAPPPTMLRPYLQRQVGQMTVMVRTSGAPANLEAAIRRAVAAADPTLPVSGYQTQTEVIERHVGKERVFTQLLVLFGGFSLLVACIGLHGVTSYAVTRRTSEFGIRIALGAQRAGLIGMVLRQVTLLALAGVTIGLPLAWLAGPAVSSFLYGLAPNDLLTIACAAMTMIVVAILAALGPARRASRLEALAALRTE